MSIDKSATTYVAGHRGLVGSAIWRRLEADGYTNLVGHGRPPRWTCASARRRSICSREVRPRYLILAAARGGRHPRERPATRRSSSPTTCACRSNVMDAAQETDVERLVFLGSSCIYPKLAPQPIKEEYLMTGPLEPTNDAYAIAKIAGILQVQSARKQYGRRWISAMPTNLYGPGDNFSPDTLPRAAGAHPPLRRRQGDAASSASRTGAAARRSASSCTSTTWRARSCSCSRSTTRRRRSTSARARISPIREIAELVAKVVGYEGEIAWDTSKPDGMPRKLLDVSAPEGPGLAPDDVARGRAARHRGVVPRAPRRDPLLARYRRASVSGCLRT